MAVGLLKLGHARNWSFLSLVYVADSWWYSGCLVFVNRSRIVRIDRIVRIVRIVAAFIGMSGDEAERGVPISSDQFAQLMGAITESHSRMEEKLGEFRTEVRQGQEEAAAKALKCARYEKPYAFKRKGNEEQAEFNAKVDETAAEAEAELMEAGTSAAPALQRALDAVRKGRQLSGKSS